MATQVYYHVFGDQYEDGDNLMTRDDLEANGIIYETRPWDADNDGEIVDSDMICLLAIKPVVLKTATEMRYWRAATAEIIADENRQ